jgi:hypothetical protein
LLADWTTAAFFISTLISRVLQNSFKFCMASVIQIPCPDIGPSAFLKISPSNVPWLINIITSTAYINFPLYTETGTGSFYVTVNPKTFTIANFSFHSGSFENYYLLGRNVMQFI